MDSTIRIGWRLEIDSAKVAKDLDYPQSLHDIIANVGVASHFKARPAVEILETIKASEVLIELVSFDPYYKDFSAIHIAGLKFDATQGPERSEFSCSLVVLTERYKIVSFTEKYFYAHLVERPENAFDYREVWGFAIDDYSIILDQDLHVTDLPGMRRVS